MSTYTAFTVHGDTACSICFEDFRADDIGVVAHSEGGEKHPVHKVCVQPWVQKHPFCPSCQAPVQLPDEQLPRSLLGKVFLLPYSANRLVERTAFSLATIYDRLMTRLHNRYGPASEYNQFYQFYEGLTHPRVLFSPYYFKFVKQVAMGMLIPTFMNAVLEAHGLPNGENDAVLWFVSCVLPASFLAYKAQRLTTREMLGRRPYSEFDRTAQTFCIISTYTLTAILLTEKCNEIFKKPLSYLFA